MKIEDAREGLEVIVIPYPEAGTRRIVALMDQVQYPGGCTLDRPVPNGDIFIHWNVDELEPACQS